MIRLLTTTVMINYVFRACSSVEVHVLCKIWGKFGNFVFIYQTFSQNDNMLDTYVRLSDKSTETVQFEKK